MLTFYALRLLPSEQPPESIPAYPQAQIVMPIEVACGRRYPSGETPDLHGGPFAVLSATREVVARLDCARPQIRAMVRVATHSVSPRRS